jgi:hypothetical protein
LCHCRRIESSECNNPRLAHRAEVLHQIVRAASEVSRSVQNRIHCEFSLIILSSVSRNQLIDGSLMSTFIALFLSLPTCPSPRQDRRRNQLMSSCNEEDQRGEESKPEDSSLRLQPRRAGEAPRSCRLRLRQRFLCRCNYPPGSR